MKKYIVVTMCVLAASGLRAQQGDTLRTSAIKEVQVQAARSQGVSQISTAVGGVNIGQDELFRAACCNLGESFVTNPSVDVNYNDAAVGARQIKLLGLSGQYVQMLAESLPLSSGVAMPYLLSYVPGAWLKSISVSKGTASVKHGPQSMTGQINIEFLKPDDPQSVGMNLYVDSRLKAEANLSANFSLGKGLSTIILAHYEQDFLHHDANHDLWHDAPAVRQMHLQNRWKYVRGRYIMHAGFGYLQEAREGGQLLKVANPYRVLIGSHRGEAYMKHAWLLDRQHNTNIALLAEGSHYALDGSFGSRLYSAMQDELGSRLVLEHDINEDHSLSAGLSFSAIGVGESLSLEPIARRLTEFTPGIYAEYSYTPSYRLTLMGGLRADYSSLYSRVYVTPRLHVKWMPHDRVTLRASVGKGFRTPVPLGESHYLLASGRTLRCDAVLPQEEAWNTGLSGHFVIPLGRRKLNLDAEYYYTHFLHQAVVDFDSDPSAIVIADLQGRSFSHTVQIDAGCDVIDELNIMAAFRYNHVRCTYGGQLLEKPLQSRFKGLLTVGWKPRMGIWQLDVTLSINGGGRMPRPYQLADGSPSWSKTFPAYVQLSAQVTREFRHAAVYIGGENLTNYRQPNPIVGASDPWSQGFDATMLWGPVHGIMAYAGVRVKIDTKK